MGLVFLARDTMPPKRSGKATGLNGDAKGGVEPVRCEGALVALKVLRAGWSQQRCGGVGGVQSQRGANARWHCAGVGWQLCERQVAG